MIVHKDVAQEVVRIFRKLYEIGYPIRQMRLVSDFMGNDWRSIEADNTSAFNCRKTSTKSGKWSKHAYGKAIDLNPLENPFVSKTGRILHAKSYRYKKGYIKTALLQIGRYYLKKMRQLKFLRNTDGDGEEILSLIRIISTFLSSLGFYFLSYYIV